MKIKRDQLIEKIKENKEKHLVEYEKAVEAYRREASKQLKSCAKELKGGSLTIKLSLITPVNRATEYDKVIEMFNWEVDNEIELTQKEFNEYVHDDNESSRLASFANTSYTR